jgi:hypothetical protein
MMTLRAGAKCTLVALLTLLSYPVQKIEIMAGVEMLLEERRCLA